MNRAFILDAIGGVDDAYIADAQKLRSGTASSGHRRLPGKRAFLIAAVLVSLLAFGGTAWASAGEGFFRDVLNWKGSIVGTAYENSTDEIFIDASASETALTIFIRFAEPRKEPYSIMDAIRIKNYEIVNESGKTVKKGQASEPGAITAGEAKIVIADFDLPAGNYAIVISELEAEKKAEQPLGISGTWRCEFTIP